jgi:hypothetical protein
LSNRPYAIATSLLHCNFVECNRKKYKHHELDQFFVLQNNLFLIQENLSLNYTHKQGKQANLKVPSCLLFQGSFEVHNMDNGTFFEDNPLNMKRLEPHL